MGVHGLWRLIEPAGKPVPLETLENKVLAVDISIWLHQAIKGFQDAKGGAIPNSHLLGIYHRVCKLLYFKIKPVFVFDGGVPALKRQTIAKRNQQKSRNSSEADRLQKQLLNTLLNHTAISKVLSEKTKASIAAQTKKSPKSKDELFMLPSSSEMDSTISSSSEEEFECDSTDSTHQSPLKQYDLHTIDTKSPYFQSLPLETRHEILTELKETRKQNSWGRLHELPKKSDDFSNYQMNRLLKRQQVQAALDDAAKEMGGASLSLSELESLLHDHGIPTSDNVGQRIASDSTTRFLYIKDIKEALEKAKLEIEKKQKESENLDEEIKPKSKADLEEEDELQRAIALSLQDEPSSSVDTDKKIQEFSFLEKFNDEDFESDTSEEDVDMLMKDRFSSAQSYMMEYSGLTPSEISKIMSQNVRGESKKLQFENIFSKGRNRWKNQVCSSNGTATLEKISEHDEIACDSTSEKPSRQICDNAEGHFDKTKSIQTMKETEVKEYRNNDNDIEKHIAEKNADSIVEGLTFDNPTESSVTAVTDNESNKIELISDTDSSNSDDFLIVEEKPMNYNTETVSQASAPVHLVINPEKKIDNDDLFKDIFEDIEGVEKLEKILTQGKDSSEDNVQGVHNSKKNSPLIENILKLPNKKNPVKSWISIDKIDDVDTNIVAKDKISGITISTKENETNTEDETKVTQSFPAPIGAKFSGKNGDYMDLPNKKEKLTNTASNLSIVQLQGMQSDLQRQKIDLLIEKGAKERLATNISDQMYQEAQELLQLFGVPYVIAPMEAEAQCAFLDEIDLTDGTITDDSDIWLFGGRTVYKNFFDQAKYVKEFEAENIKHHFKLSRQQMILLALLVGSDYTIGVRGIGPVTALEILSSFPPPQSSEFDLTQAQLISGLKEFKAWFYKGQSSGPGRSVLKNKLKNITFSENFPNVQVVQAYMEPKVETSREKFSWAKPDFVALTLFAREKLGWSSKKTEEILNPVIKRVEESRIQKSIKEYFKTKFKLDSGDAGEKMSKRVKLAIERFGKTPEELIAEEMELLEKEKEKKLKKCAQILEGESKRKYCKRDKIQSLDVTHNESKDNEVTSTQRKNKKDQQKSTGLSKSNDSDPLKEFQTVKNPKKHTDHKTSISDIVNEPPTKTRRKVNTKNKKDDLKSSVSKKTPTNLLKEVESVSDKNSSEELKLYENVAIELRQRRKRRNDLAKMKMNEPQPQRKKNRETKPIQNQLVECPAGLKDDVEIQNLMAVASTSVQKVEEIHSDVQNHLNQDKQKRNVAILHSKEVIHQKLKDQSDLLKNKLKAIEVFRKSKKGPGYVPKRGRKTRTAKEEAGLSEDSDN